MTANGYSPSTLAQLPAIQNLQTNGAVNLFRGDVNLPVELISLPGGSDLDVKIAILYQSNNQHLVDRCCFWAGPVSAVL